MLGCALLGVLTTSTAAAQTETAVTTATLRGSTLDVAIAPGAGEFAGSLDGTAHELSGDGLAGFTVTDARGSGAGWQVAMKASRFVNEDAGGTALAPDSLMAPLFIVTKADPGSSAVPGRVTAASIDNDTGAIVASCTEARQGMGSFAFSAPAGSWKLAVTAHEFAGTYSSTITVTVSTLAL